MPTPSKAPGVLTRAQRALVEFFRLEAAGGIVLILAAVLALILVNSPVEGMYRAVIDPVHHWINDGLMAVFFLLVALEIKREALSGQLAGREQLVLPLVCAAAGVLVPAALAFALVLYPMLKGDLRISKREGGVLVLAFVAWLLFELYAIAH